MDHSSTHYTILHLDKNTELVRDGRTIYRISGRGRIAGIHSCESIVDALTLENIDDLREQYLRKANENERRGDLVDEEARFHRDRIDDLTKKVDRGQAVIDEYEATIGELHRQVYDLRVENNGLRAELAINRSGRGRSVR